MNSKPLELHLLDKRKHLTREEMENRRRNQIRFGDENLIVPKHIRKNKVAYKKWRELSQLYSNVEYVASPDSDLIAMYCQAYSEYLEAMEQKTAISTEGKSKGFNTVTIQDMLNKLNIDYKIMKLRESLMKMEKELYLTPTARLKNVGRKEKEKDETPIEKAGFGFV